MGRTPKDVTDAELRVLEILWQVGPSPARDISDRIYKKGTFSEYATVQKLLQRLAAKGFVQRCTVGRARGYRARIGREDLINRRIRAIAEKLCGGSLTPIIHNLVKTNALSAADRKALRESLNAAGSTRTRSKKKRV